MREERCFRAIEAHDLETMQHALSAAGSSCRWLAMRSSCSGGRGHGIVIWLRRTVETDPPDLSNSLARHTRTFSFLELCSTTLVNPDIVSWIRSFHRVENLILGFTGGGHGVSLVQLPWFSSALRSPGRFYSPTLKIFNLISSFPLPEDLTSIIMSPTPVTPANGFLLPPHPSSPDPFG